MQYLLKQLLEAETHVAPMVVTLCARYPLLEPFLVLQIGKTWPLYGPNMVHLKSDVMKIAYYIQDQHLAMFKTSILPKEQTK